jgi:hypothetical protein
MFLFPEGQFFTLLYLSTVLFPSVFAFFFPISLPPFSPFSSHLPPFPVFRHGSGKDDPVLRNIMKQNIRQAKCRLYRMSPNSYHKLQVLDGKGTSTGLDSHCFWSHLVFR